MMMHDLDLGQLVWEFGGFMGWNLSHLPTLKTEKFIQNYCFSKLYWRGVRYQCRMVDAHIIVKGRPVSIQNVSGVSLNSWKTRVANDARPKFSTPSTDDDLKVEITFFYDIPPTFDMDNISKPICDALNGIVYVDDNQIMSRHASKKSLDGPYYIRNLPTDLAVALAEGEEFVYIRITNVGEEKMRIQ